MRLQRLTGLERQKIVDEYEETLKLIERLKAILASERMQLKIVIDELVALKEQFGDDRRTEIVAHAEEISVEDLIPEEEVVITVSHTGYVKRTALSTYRSQRRGGKGRIGMTTRDEDAVRHLFIASTHDYILVFTSSGKMYWLKVHEIPDVSLRREGPADRQHDPDRPRREGLRDAQRCASSPKGKFVVMASRRGYIKKTSLSAFSNVRANGIIALTLDPGDDVSGRRSFGRRVRDLHGDLQGEGDPLQGDRRPPDGAQRARGDRHPHGAGRPPRRDGGALREAGHPLADRERLRQAHGRRRVPAAGARRLRHHQHPDDRDGTGWSSAPPRSRDDEQILMITAHGKIIRMNASGISRIGRATQGVRLIQMEEGDVVVSAIRTAEREEEGT